MCPSLNDSPAFARPTLISLLWDQSLPAFAGKPWMTHGGHLDPAFSQLRGWCLEELLWWCYTMVLYFEQGTSPDQVKLRTKYVMIRVQGCRWRDIRDEFLPLKFSITASMALAGRQSVSSQIRVLWALGHGEQMSWSCVCTAQRDAGRRLPHRVPFQIFKVADEPPLLSLPVLQRVNCWQQSTVHN